MNRFGKLFVNIWGSPNAVFKKQLKMFHEKSGKSESAICCINSRPFVYCKSFQENIADAFIGQSEKSGKLQELIS